MSRMPVDVVTRSVLTAMASAPASQSSSTGTSFGGRRRTIRRKEHVRNCVKVKTDYEVDLGETSCGQSNGVESPYGVDRARSSPTRSSPAHAPCRSLPAKRERGSR